MKYTRLTRHTHWLLTGLLLVLIGCDDTSTEDPVAADAQLTADRGIIQPDMLAPDAAIVADDASTADAADAAIAPDADITGGVLEVVPQSTTLLLLEGQPAPTAQLGAQWVVGAGEIVPVAAAQITWRVEPQVLGAIDAAGLFTASGQIGRATVIAEVNGDTARGEVFVLDIEDVIEGGAPADAPTRFQDAPAAEGCAPALIYPQPFTVFPRNVIGIRFQWNAEGHDLFRASFRAGDVAVSWFTRENSVTPSGQAWDNLMRSALNHGLVMTVSGMGARGDSACSGIETHFEVDGSLLQGAVYYWSTSNSGIMRLPVDELEAEPFLTPAVAPQINCPACHALSRDGNQIAFTRTTFPPFGDLAISPIDTPAETNYDPTGVAGYFPSFHPDGTLIVGGTGGQLVVRDTQTGVETDRLPIPEGRVGGEPDWSWQGDRIAAALGTGGLNNPLPDVGISRGAIAEWMQIDGVWQEPEVLVEQVGEENNDRPAYSPDGTWMAFERSGDNPSENSGNPTAKLLAIGPDGTVIELSKANLADGLGNSWPKWSPTDRRGRMWLAFSSLRNYGHVLRNDTREFANPQIWVTSIDPDAPPGTDPSSPAFWLPGQNPESGNHIPYWARYEKE